MSTVDYIRDTIVASGNLVMALVDDLADAPLQVPTSRGGNPPLWILGHLAYAESNIVEHIIRGNENPLLDWKPVFGAGQEPSVELDVYPKWSDVRDRFDEVRRGTLAYVDGLTDGDLAQPTVNCPEGRESFFGTVGSCLRVISLHPMMHYGQLADARRMLGRPPLRG